MRFGCKDFSLTDRPRPLVIAEIGVNHNGDPDLARRMVDAAVAAGADIVKFQAFRSAREISCHAACAPYQRQGERPAANQLELCRALELSPEVLAGLLDYCDARGVPSLVAAFESASLDFLTRDLGLATVKIPSGEVTNLPLLAQAGASGAAVILSTGASLLWEVGRAVDVLRRAGCPEILLLHCVSEYPVPPGQLNLRAMATMAQAFKVPVGFSDHSLGTAAAIAASALGAVAVEKHFTLDRGLPGPDHQASIEPDELAALVAGVRLAALALGDGIKAPQACERDNLPLIRKGLVAGAPLAAGTVLAPGHLEVKRPAVGVEPGDLDKVVGRRLGRSLAADEPLRWSDLA